MTQIVRVGHMFIDIDDIGIVSEPHKNSRYNQQVLVEVTFKSMVTDTCSSTHRSRSVLLGKDQYVDLLRHLGVAEHDIPNYTKWWVNTV